MSAPVVIVVPEPCDWLAPLLRRLPEITGGELSEVELIAPWILDAEAPRWLPARVRTALGRRRSPEQGLRLGSPARARAAWLAVEAAVSIWAGSDVARRLRSRFAIRRAVDAIAARRARTAEVVIAPSGCAERSFAAAPASCRRVLICDFPSLRRLHEDLDAAAAVHPGARFLRRFRAPAGEVARQEVERLLADQLLVRGTYARDAAVSAGIPASRITPFGGEPHPTAKAPKVAATSGGETDRGLRILLAGGGAARGGSHEALAALEDLERATLVVSPGEGREPAYLMSHPRVRASNADERDRLAGIDVVIAPAWCECYPREVALARALGVPVMATVQAAGFGPSLIARGQSSELAAAVRRGASPRATAFVDRKLIS